uniref:Reverse transcriptase domain-containing protein n=1 Tax=Cannabis sativa TaxID=3483 RepID=A0A803Q0U5_CANSA
MSGGNISFRLTGVYDEPNRSKRKLTWDLIEGLTKRSDFPWCLIGDMNNVLSQSDKKGGKPYPNWLIQGFKGVVDRCRLIDMELMGYPYTWERNHGATNWIECIQPSITLEQNDNLLQPITEEEVKTAVFQMHPDKSLGPNGMRPGFYQKFWSIVGKDVINLAKNFFTTAAFEEHLTEANIVLIPKKKNPVTMADLRPISLCNVAYKVVSKVLTNRLKRVLNHVISEIQSAFIPGRLITNNMISYEVMHYLKRKRSGKKGSMAVKLNMSKAYDRVEWGYLETMLRHMGFVDKIVGLFMACVTTARYKISHAGQEFGNIIPHRGLRQGDPLSSYLFLICAKTCDEICGMLNIHEADDHSIYLGLPNIIGRKKTVIMAYLKDKVQQRVQGWERGLGFCNLHDFNMALLGKQRWRLLTRPDSLVSKVYNSRYYSNGSFLSAKLGGKPSYIWKSIFEAHELIKKGAAVRVGQCNSVQVVNVPWLPCVEDPYVHTVTASLQGKTVSSLMTIDQAQWDEDLIKDIFIDRDVNLILSTPFAPNEPDIWYWRLKNLGHYSVKSAYRQLQNDKEEPIGRDNGAYWNKLWNLKSAFSNSSSAECQLISTLVWAIWKSRNELVWDNKHRTVCDVVVLARTVLDQWKSAQEKTFEVSSELQTSDVGYERWRTPIDDMIKVNTDAAIFAHTNCYNFSFVARDHTCSLVKAKSKCIQGKVQPSINEVIGIREALSWIKN